ncbi:MAG: hemin uptake protein HemP [Bosea sp.]|nr:hemin uptake protein HemP [Bosea sp. (in: a-proteobacteria)]
MPDPEAEPMPDVEPMPVLAEAPAEARETGGPRIVTSEALLQGGREVIIRHGGDDYRLRLTRVGKLILNK